MSKSVLQRELFDELKVKYKGCPINRTQLRSDVLLAASSQYKFNITTNSGATQTSSENWLEQNDIFVATSWTFLLGTKLATAGAGNKKLFTCPNNLASSATGGGLGPNGLNTQALYNGKMNLTIQSTLWLKNVEILPTLLQPISQKGVAVSQNVTLSGTGATAVAPSLLTNDSVDFSDLYIDMGGYIVFPGNQQPQLTINCDAVNMAGDTSYENYAILMFDGFLVQNGAM